MNKKIVVLFALVAIAGFAAASALTVKQRQDTASLHAERYTVGELFAIEASTLTPVAASLPAAGVPGSPVEMTSGLAAARTALVRDHWMYTVVVKEIGVAAIPSGQYTIELQLDGASIATLYVSQATAEAGAVEGVRASFGLGPIVQTSSLYYVVVKPYVPTGPTLAFTVRSNPNDNLTWLGVGGSIEGLVNPTLPAALGSTIQLTARNADDLVHNIGFKSGSSLIDPPGWSTIIDAAGEEVVIAWTPGAAGTYTYVCQFHASMTGTITIA